MPRTYQAGVARRQQILDYVTLYWNDHKIGPAGVEIAVETGLSRTAVRHHVDRLVADGQLYRDPARNRSLRPVLPPSELAARLMLAPPALAG